MCAHLIPNGLTTSGRVLLFVIRSSLLWPHPPPWSQRMGWSGTKSNSYESWPNAVNRDKLLCTKRKCCTVRAAGLKMLCEIFIIAKRNQRTVAGGCRIIRHVADEPNWMYIYTHCTQYIYIYIYLPVQTERERHHVWSGLGENRSCSDCTLTTFNIQVQKNHQMCWQSLGKPRMGSEHWLCPTSNWFWTYLSNSYCAQAQTWMSVQLVLSSDSKSSNE